MTQKALCSRRWLLLPTSSHRWGFTLVQAWKRKCVSGRFFFWFLNPTSVHLNLDQVAPPERRLLRGISTISYEIWASTQLNSSHHSNTSWNPHQLASSSFSQKKFLSILSLLDLLHNCLRSRQGSDEGQRPCRLSEADFYSSWPSKSVNLSEMAMLIWRQWQIWLIQDDERSRPQPLKI